jgi:hypothetical protein
VADYKPAAGVDNARWPINGPDARVGFVFRYYRRLRRGKVRAICRAAFAMMDEGPHRKGANMTTTLEELDQRLGKLEQEMEEMRRLVRRPPVEGGATSALQLVEQALREKPRLRVLAAKALEQMGISGHPVPPETLRQMMAEAGIRPEENLFSRGIEEMREE